MTPRCDFVSVSGMSPVLLPPLPSTVQGLRPLYVGAAARLGRGGAGLHMAPEVWLREAPPGPVHGWDARVVADEDVEPTLVARAVPVDAFAVSPEGEVVDPLGGVADLERRCVRLPDPDAITADPSLLVNVVAMAGELAVRPDDAALATLADRAGLVLRADRDALREAMTRLLVGRRPAGGLGLLQKCGVLPLVLPEVSALVDFHRSSRHHHKDVWRHTLQVVRQAMPRPTIRWAALLHDVGKVHTRSFGPGQKVHFFRHDELGALLVEGIAARLRFPAELADPVRELVLLHLRANLYDRSWSDSAIRRFTVEIGDAMPSLLDLSRADVTSRRPGRRREAMYNLFHLRGRIAEVRALDRARRPLVPKGLGARIIADLGVPPGREIGELRRACEQAVREGELPESPGADACIEWLRARRAS